MKIMIKHGNEILDMPSGTISTIGNCGIARLYYKELETAFNFKRIATAENVLIQCYNETDFDVVKAFRNKAEKAGTADA